MTAEQLIATEEEIRELWENGELPYLVHLCGGNEKALIEIFEDIKPTDWVFASHRCHWHWLLHHRDQEFFNPSSDSITHSASEELIARIERGLSMFLFGPRFVCSAIVAGTASIAAGMALAIKRRGGSERVWHFGGDGCEESGHYSEAVYFVADRGLDCTFILENNNSSCGVTKEQRRGEFWGHRKWPSCVKEYSYKPTWPHAGSHVRPQLKWRSP